MVWARRLGLVVTIGMICLVAAAFVLDRVFPLPLDRVTGRSTLVLDAKGEPLRAFQTDDGHWRFTAAPADVDPLFLRMLIAYEDRRFADHPGVDPAAVVRAVGQAIGAGRVVSGASTLTMQTARLIEPRPRNLGAKLIEMARALQLEWHLPKDEILGLYLTLAPYGGNLEGVRAASLFYFGKEPDRLTVAEAALLVSLPQSPERRRPDRNAGVAQAERDRVLGRLVEAGVITQVQAAEAMEEPVPVTRLPAPFLAPHLAERLHLAAPDQSIILSNIDADLQGKVEALAVRAITQFEASANIAILVVANDSRRVVASVGSSGYFETRRAGPIDMTTAIRSPGSTLKPFIYGLGFEDLVCHPETIVVDRPMHFGGYAPKNFDRMYRGEVKITEALQLSLNIPAVAVLDLIGPRRFAGRLAQAGVTLRLPDKAAEPSLPIALGGVGLTLRDLVTLYAALADGGRALPLRDRADAPAGEAAALLSASAAWQVAAILRDTPPPPHLLPGESTANGRQIAYKTGTSYGFRDAWAVGFDRDYTIGIWVGRPDGSFSPGRMGRDAAAPVLYAAFGMLPPPSAEALRRAPPPAGTLIATQSELPPGLKRLRPRRADPLALAPAERSGPRLTLPLNGSTVEVARGSDGTLPTVLLQAQGGTMPLTWLVNGVPIGTSPFRRQAEWQPDGLGRASVTVIDAAGRAVSADFWLATAGS
ncbi:penicillin-binding protein 1C [Oleomonas cavernae]|uniref:peptidoglycan glycosyltransferase n=1 Tax=Oleomonas cavernae TaxID=2320859 RepID=A0A418WGI6_9PROT|nr:penicillin-binding protein 1C [Oleomonas cavernae]RJF89127.1 penicillin-binding protein 1C [Oleomonas cavernae]